MSENGGDEHGKDKKPEEHSEEQHADQTAEDENGLEDEHGESEEHHDEEDDQEEEHEEEEAEEAEVEETPEPPKVDPPKVEPPKVEPPKPKPEKTEGQEPPSPKQESPKKDVKKSPPKVAPKQQKGKNQKVGKGKAAATTPAGGGKQSGGGKGAINAGQVTQQGKGRAKKAQKSTRIKIVPKAVVVEEEEEEEVDEEEEEEYDLEPEGPSALSVLLEKLAESMKGTASKVTQGAKSVFKMLANMMISILNILIYFGLIYSLAEFVLTKPQPTKEFEDRLNVVLTSAALPICIATFGYVWSQRKPTEANLRFAQECFRDVIFFLLNAVVATSIKTFGDCQSWVPAAGYVVALYCILHWVSLAWNISHLRKFVLPPQRLMLVALSICNASVAIGLDFRYFVGILHKADLVDADHLENAELSSSDDMEPVTNTTVNLDKCDNVSRVPNLTKV